MQGTGFPFSPSPYFLVIQNVLIPQGRAGKVAICLLAQYLEQYEERESTPHFHYEPWTLRKLQVMGRTDPNTNARLGLSVTIIIRGLSFSPEGVDMEGLDSG